MSHRPQGPHAERTGTTLLLSLRDLHGDTIGTEPDHAFLPRLSSPWGEATWSGTSPPLGFHSTGWEAGVHATAETAGSLVGGFLGGAASVMICGPWAPLCGAFVVPFTSWAGRKAGDWVGDQMIADRPACTGTYVPAGRGFYCRG